MTDKNSISQDVAMNNGNPNNHNQIPKSLLEIVAANINTLIESQDISAKELHELTGYSEPAISKYRTAKQQPPLDFFLQLKKIYDISIDDFLTREILPVNIINHMPQSPAEQAENDSYHKFCGNYIVYYLNTSSYKGRDKFSPDESLLYGVLSITENRSMFDNTTDYNCISVLGIKDRSEATMLKQKLDQMKFYSEIEKYISVDEGETLSEKTYYGKLELSPDHAFITLSLKAKDKALIILHRWNTNKKEYIGGIGAINSVSEGHEPMPVAQYIALTRYPITLSAEEIHHQLLLGHPTYKADDDAKDLIALFKKTYMAKDSDEEIHTELEKFLIMKVNLGRYVKESLKKNMFRHAKISKWDDAAWYDLLKEVSITDDNIEPA